MGYVEGTTMHKIPLGKIYKKKLFSFHSNCSTKTFQKTIPLSTKHVTIYLLPEESLEKHQLKYNSLHIGLVQIALQPLTRTGLSTSITLSLRDRRHGNITDSTLGIIESSLSSGSIYFNCYPKFSVSLEDPSVHRALTISVKTDGYNMLPESLPMALTFRICYKVVKTVIMPEPLVESSNGRTALLQTITQAAKIIAPETIKWDDVSPRNDWISLYSGIPTRQEDKKDNKRMEPDGGNPDLSDPTKSTARPPFKIEEDTKSIIPNSSSQTEKKMIQDPSRETSNSKCMDHGCV